jgi:hypothetical protein
MIPQKPRRNETSRDHAAHNPAGQWMYCMKLLGQSLMAITLRANRSETYCLLKFTLEGPGERTHGYALTGPACRGCCV